MKKRYWTAIFECEKTHIDWGKAGARNQIGNIEAINKQEALAKANNLRPGNWKVLGVVEQFNGRDGGEDA